MNFLAHVYLSGSDELLQIGNFIGDAVKGKQHENYHPTIQKGILLHRAIDSYTDEHPVHALSRKRLRENFGKYSGVITDIYYDHFLAAKWLDFHDEELGSYTQSFYERLRSYLPDLPVRIQRMYPYMVRADWLGNYGKFERLQEVMNGMDSRTGNKSGMRYSVDYLQDNYAFFEEDFDAFFPELIAFAQGKR